MAGLGPSTFDPSEAKLRMFLSEVADPSTEAGLAARYGPEVGFSNLGFTPSVARVSVGGNIAGFGSEPESLSGAINTGPFPMAHPLRASVWEMNHLTSLLGAHDTPTQLDASTAHRIVFDNRQTDVEWNNGTPRAMWYYFDKTGDTVERFGPAHVQSWVVNVANSSVVSSLWNVIAQHYGLHEGILDIDTGTPTTVPIWRGFLSPDNQDLLAAEQQLNLKVTGAPTGAGTPADPKVITFTADLGSSPVFGVITFTVTCGPEPGEGGAPRWSRVIDSTSGTELGDPAIGVPLDIAILDVAGTGYADLDVVSMPLASPWTPVLTTEPTLLSVQTCVSLDGIQLVTIDSLDFTITNRRVLSLGGFCRAMSQSFNNSGNIVFEAGIGREWITDRVQRLIINGRKLSMVTTINSGLEIDPGTSNETYRAVIEVPNMRPSDGSTLMSFPGGAADQTETLAYTGHPDSSIGDASVRVTLTGAVADPEV